MNKVKALLSITICVVLMTFVFIACSNEGSVDDTASSIDLTDEINDEINSQLDDESKEILNQNSDSLPNEFSYTIDENNDVIVETDNEKLNNDLDDFKDLVKESVSSVYEFTQNDEFAKDDNKNNVEDENYVEKDYVETIDEILSSIGYSSRGILVEGDRIYQTDENGEKKGYQTFVIDGDLLVITGSYNMDELPADDDNEYPIIININEE
jgi:hypothetical protein